MYVNVWAQQDEKVTFSKQKIETQTERDLQLITENFEISGDQKEKLFNFFKYKNKFLSQSSFNTEQRKSIVKSRFKRYIQNVLNESNNGPSIVLSEDLLNHLNLQEIKIPNQ